MRFLLVGNYGVGNVGDEALKEYFLQTFPDIEWCVLSARPNQNEYPRFPAGIRSFFGLQWIKTLNALRQSDGMVFGGGSLFTDVESSRACWLWWCHAFWAWLLGKKIFLTFQGIGPYHTWLGKTLTRWVVRRVVYISVRDEMSLQRVRKWQPKAEVVQSFDPIFSSLQMEDYNLAAEKQLVVIPRKNSDNALLHELNMLLQSGRWEKVLCVSLQPGDRQEQAYILQLRQSVHQAFEILEVRTLEELHSAVSQGSFVLTQRYHGAIAALALGRELQVLPQSENDKIASIQHIIANIPLAARKPQLTDLVQAGESSLRKKLSK